MQSMLSDSDSGKILVTSKLLLMMLMTYSMFSKICLPTELNVLVQTLWFSFVSITLGGGPMILFVRVCNGLEGSAESQQEHQAPDSFAA